MSEDEIRIPPEAIRFRAVRASGPGGQNVNRVATKVELRLDPASIEGLDDAGRRRLASLARLDAVGSIIVTSQRFRDQAKNRRDAEEKLTRLVERAATPPKPRRATKISAAARARRVVEKRRQGERKRRRREIERDE